MKNNLKKSLVAIKSNFYIDELTCSLFNHRKALSIFVINKSVLFIIDNLENFILNMKLDLDLDFKNGNITLEQYQDEMNSYYYRNGIWQLTKDNFESYLQSDSVIVLKKDELKELMFQGFTSAEAVRLYSVVENKLSYNDPISDSGQQSDFLKINQISSRLPLFYINFDTEVYLHMDWDRCHEDYVYDGWFSKAMDFGYLIPDEFCYWKIEGRDYWKFRQL